MSKNICKNSEQRGGDMMTGSIFRNKPCKGKGESLYFGLISPLGNGRILHLYRLHHIKWDGWLDHIGWQQGNFTISEYMPSSIHMQNRRSSVALNSNPCAVSTHPKVTNYSSISGSLSQMEHTEITLKE